MICCSKEKLEQKLELELTLEQKLELTLELKIPTKKRFYFLCPLLRKREHLIGKSAYRFFLHIYLCFYTKYNTFYFIYHIMIYHILILYEILYPNII